VVIIPLVGASLDRGYGTAAFVLLSIFVVVAGLTNAAPRHPRSLAPPTKYESAV
jgi:hypothetical protein